MTIEIEPLISIEKAAWLVGTDISSIRMLTEEKTIKSHQHKITGEYWFFESDIRKQFKLGKMKS